ncbi:MAG: hypothetical protein R2795_14000 [Saprospiraceae bacterium]
METLIFTEEELKEGGGKLTVDVFLEPYTDPNSMLPLILYYDNDHPNPRSTSPTTDLEYVATNVEYFKTPGVHPKLHRRNGVGRGVPHAPPFQ